MKTRFFKLIMITLFLTVSGCKEDSETNNSENLENSESQITGPKEELEALQKYLDTPLEFQTSVPTSFDFCKTNEAILPQNRYNRATGIANFSIPMPKGSNLKYVRMDKDELIFECNGNGKVPYSANDLFIYQKTVAGLTRGDYNKRLFVTVLFTNFKGSDCPNMEFVQQKKKTSEVSGSPK